MCIRDSTTTILERGITISNIQVIILYGDNRIYETATLIPVSYTHLVCRRLAESNGDNRTNR